jgi:hypothetical protein
MKFTSSVLSDGYVTGVGADVTGVGVDVTDVGADVFSFHLSTYLI